MGTNVFFIFLNFKNCFPIDNHCKRWNVFSDLLKITRIFWTLLRVLWAATFSKEKVSWTICHLEKKRSSHFRCLAGSTRRNHHTVITFFVSMVNCYFKSLIWLSHNLLFIIKNLTRRDTHVFNIVSARSWPGFRSSKVFKVLLLKGGRGVLPPTSSEIFESSPFMTGGGILWATSSEIFYNGGGGGGSLSTCSRNPFLLQEEFWKILTTFPPSFSWTSVWHHSSLLAAANNFRSLVYNLEQQK